MNGNIRREAVGVPRPPRGGRVPRPPRAWPYRRHRASGAVFEHVAASTASSVARPSTYRRRPRQ